MSKQTSQLVGQKIVCVRRMTNEEREVEGWGDDPQPTFALELDSGTVLYPSRDEEGNGGGALFGIEPKWNGESFFRVMVPSRTIKKD